MESGVKHDKSPPEYWNISHSDPLALSGKRSGTKFNCAVKGTALLQLVSLSTDAPQRSSRDIFQYSGYILI